MENQRPEALRLADKLKDAIQLLDLGFDEDIDPDELDKAALELEALHARVQELEAMLEAVGAGGVSAQRVTQAADHIEQDRKMVAAQEPLGYVTHYGRFVRQLKDIRADDRFNRLKWRAVFAAPQPQADGRDAERVDALYTALEVCSAELFAQCAHQGRAMKYVEQARKALAAEQCTRAAIAVAKEHK